VKARSLKVIQASQKAHRVFQATVVCHQTQAKAKARNRKATHRNQTAVNQKVRNQKVIQVLVIVRRVCQATVVFLQNLAKVFQATVVCPPTVRKALQA
jgi:hypothetical protein